MTVSFFILINNVTENFWCGAFCITFNTGKLLVLALTAFFAKGVILFTLLTKVECSDFSAISCVV